MHDISPAPATIRDVARLAGVGVGTVSRYVSGNGAVKTTTRERIREAIETLNYKPNVHAMSLRGAASKTVGIVVPDISNPLFATIIKKLEERLRAARYSVVLTSPSGEASEELEIASDLLRRRVEGLFLIPCAEDNTALKSILLQEARPAVIIDRYFLLDRPGFAHIQTDHATGMKQALGCLIETGHRDILLLYVDSHRPGLERAKAFRTAAAALGRSDVRASAIPGSQYTSFAHDAVIEQYTGAYPPDAIVVGHNQMLPHVLSALRRLGRRVGLEISLITSDRTDLSEFHAPQIASITRDLERIGDIAFEMFEELRKQTDASPVRTITTTFCRTESVRDLLRPPFDAKPATSSP